MKKTLAFLPVLFACHRLYAPIIVSATLNPPVISGGNVIVSGVATPASTSFWTLEQSSDLSPGSWTPSPQQPVFVLSNFSCTNGLLPNQLFYRLKH